MIPPTSAEVTQTRPLATPVTLPETGGEGGADLGVGLLVVGVFVVVIRLALLAVQALGLGLALVGATVAVFWMGFSLIRRRRAA